MSKKTRRTSAPRAPPYSSTHTLGDLPTEGAGHRQARLEHILLDELQSLIRDASDPSLNGITLLSVHLSPDGGHARIAYAAAAPLHCEQERGRATREGLARATGFLRSRLAQQLNLKKLPMLTFTFVGVVQNDAGVDENAGGDPCLE